MKKEIKIIRKVLKDYAQLKEDLELINARQMLISSPNFNGSAGHDNLNHIESKYVYHADISNKLHQVESAINQIDDLRYRVILYDYIADKKYKRQDICNMYNISLRSFNDIKNKALLEFAKNYGIDLLSDKVKDNLMYN